MGNERFAFSSRRKGAVVFTCLEHVKESMEMARFDSLDDVNLHYPRVVNFHCKAEKTDLLDT